eukprot:TRINITY_DN36287_c0_g1_i5.p1 TRINITY_DN36287_c0_g1~~TRINITY_DN36287_c0_g1_i5.p1  ORF type:complete len:289 (-),score=-28.15 TRINITY_DN36287_c0_g1_i5:63-929(-)
MFHYSSQFHYPQPSHTFTLPYLTYLPACNQYQNSFIHHLFHSKKNPAHSKSNTCNDKTLECCQIKQNIINEKKIYTVESSCSYRSQFFQKFLLMQKSYKQNKMCVNYCIGDQKVTVKKFDQTLRLYPYLKNRHCVQGCLCKVRQYCKVYQFSNSTLKISKMVPKKSLDKVPLQRQRRYKRVYIFFILQIVSIQPGYANICQNELYTAVPRMLITNHVIGFKIQLLQCYQKQQRFFFIQINLLSSSSSTTTTTKKKQQMFQIGCQDCVTKTLTIVQSCVHQNNYYIFQC